MYKKISVVTLFSLLLTFNMAHAQQPAVNNLTPAQQQAAQSLLNNLPPVQQQATQPNLPPAQQQVGQPLLNNLTPAQKQVVQVVLSKTAGVLTPQAIEALKQSPEFKDFTFEDIAKAKELIEKSFISQGVAEPKPSSFERSRQVGKYQEIGLQLTPFGYDFFYPTTVGAVFDRTDIPVPAKYVVGPGDEVKILLWGRVNAQYSLTIDRNGSINIPQVGPLYVAGMTFEQMSTYLIKQTTQIVGANIDITMGALKTIPIFILGDVKKPGSYTIGSFATITDALLLSGGPSEIGSMRNIQLKRKGTVVANFDLYSLLLKGDKSADAILQAGDVVFIPVSGPLVGIAGNVKRPAIYELKDNFALSHIIELAGGMLPTAYTQQIQVSRIQKNERQMVVDINDKNLNKSLNLKLQDADLVKIFTIVDKDQNSLYLEGNVKKPGMYEYKKGMRVSDLIKNSSELLDETHYDYALIRRLILPQRSIELVPFNLGKIILNNDKKENLELRPEDHVYIFSKWLFKDKPYVTVEGEIRGACSSFLNTYIMDKTIGDSNGKTDPLNSGLMNITLGDSTNNNTELKASVMTKIGEVNVELKKNFEGNEDLLFKMKSITDELKKRETAPVREILEVRDELQRRRDIDLVEKMDSIIEEITRTCKLELASKMRVRDAILNSGGLTNNSYLEKAEIIRENDNKEYSTVYFNVTKAMSGDAVDNVLLRHKDKIVIHSTWEYDTKKIVYADGDVSNPGVYQFTDNLKVSDLVFKTGLLESAYLNEAELASQILVDGKIVKTQYQKINLRKAINGDPYHNILLKPYDRLMVKRITNWKESKFVEISGEVNFMGRYIIKKGDRLSSLIERAGGYTNNAYLRGATFTRRMLKETQQKNIEEIAIRLEKELLVGSAVSTALSAEEIQGKKIELEQKKQLIENLRKTKVMGRMTIKLAHLRLLKGSEFDIELEEGDTLFIPGKNSVVSVTGSVMGQGSYMFSEKADYLDYVNMSGGFSNYADTGNVFILKVDGSARRAHRGLINWNENKERLEMSAFSEEESSYIEPGDTIVVPEKVEKIAWLREIRDITQILMNMAVAAGVVIKLF